MTPRRVAAVALIAFLVAPAVLLARQNILKNGSMEFGQGAGAIDPQVAAEWAEFGRNVERSGAYNLAPPDGGHALKAFGDSENNAAGASQIVLNVAPGQSVQASVMLFSPAGDKLGGSGEAGLVLEFLNQFNGTIAPVHSVYALNAASPASTWIPAVIGPLTAPPTTVKVRVTCRLRWTPGDVFGAAYWDDAQLTINGGPNALVNGDFETAGASTGQSPVGIDDWMGFNDQEKSDDVAWHGTASLQLGTREDYSGLYQFMRPLSDGDHLYMVAKIWNPAIDPLTDSSMAGIKLEFKPNTEVPPPEEYLPFDETYPADQWFLVDMTTTVPDGATIAKIVCIWVGDQTTTGAIHFETAFAEVSSAPGVNLLGNASFESGPGGPNGLDFWSEFNTPGVSQCEKRCFEAPPLDGWCTARGAGAAVSGILQEILVTPGETLHLGAYLYTPTWEKLTGTGVAGVKVEWAAGGVPASVDIGAGPNTVHAGAPTNTWIPVYIDYTMPPGSSARTQYTNILARESALSGRAYFDGCEAVVLNRFDGSDVDGDDDEDLHDFAWFQLCYTGAGAGALPYNGIVFDHDDDLDVDMVDFNWFAPRMLGPQ